MTMRRVAVLAAIAAGAGVVVGVGWMYSGPRKAKR